MKEPIVVKLTSPRTSSTEKRFKLFYGSICQKPNSKLGDLLSIESLTRALQADDFHRAPGVGVETALRFDATKPDGTMRKLMDSQRLFAMGWQPKIKLAEGLRKTYGWYLDNVAVARRP